MVVGRLLLCHIRQLLEIQRVFVQPLTVGPGADDFLFQLFVTDNAALLRIDQEHPSGLEPSFLQDAFRLNFEHPYLGTHDDQVILGDVVPRRPEAVAVQDGPHAGAVGEGDGGRAIPGLHQATVIFIKGPFCVGHAGMILPRLGDHHHHRMGQRTSAQRQEFQAVIKNGGITAVFQDNRKDLRQVVTKEFRGHECLPGAHPVDVPPQGINLAVVDEVAIRVGALPTRKGIGAKAGMDQGDSAFHVRVGQVRVEGFELLRGEHTLIDQGLIRQAGNIEILAAGDPAVANGVRHAPADYIQLALKGEIIRQPLRAATNENLPNARFTRLGRFSQVGVIGRDIPPAQDRLAFFPDDSLQALLAILPLGLIRWQIDHADPVLARSRQADSQSPTDCAQKAMGELDEHPRPVSGPFFAAACSTMIQIDQNG